MFRVEGKTRVFPLPVCVRGRLIHLVRRTRALQLEHIHYLQRLPQCCTSYLLFLCYAVLKSYRAMHWRILATCLLVMTRSYTLSMHHIYMQSTDHELIALIYAHSSTGASCLAIYGVYSLL